MTQHQGTAALPFQHPEQQLAVAQLRNHKIEPSISFTLLYQTKINYIMQFFLHFLLIIFIETTEILLKANTL